MWSNDGPNVAIVGATGAVGTTLLSLFEERRFRYADLHLIASPRSEGRMVAYRGRRYRVANLESFDFSRVELVFCSAGTKVSRVWARRISEQGPLVIDNTNAFRMDPATPLVVPQVNGHLLNGRPRTGIIANPNCTTIPVTRVLHPIDARYHVRKVVISTYQAASGGGLAGIEELKDGSRRILDGTDREPVAERFPVPLAFNLIPSIDVVLDNGFTLEEQKIVQESRKIMNRPDLEVTATAVRVPVINCHCEAVYFECAEQLSRAHLVELLRRAPEITVYDGEGPAGYPTPRQIVDCNRVHVGRIRVDPGNPRAAWLWVVSDNLRIGAALNAIQIAEALSYCHAG